jgi:hypothetical protein
VLQRGAKNIIWGKVVVSQVWAVVNFVSRELLVACPNIKGALKSELTNLLVGLM